MYFFKKVPKTGQSCTAFGASFVQESLCDIFQSVHTSPLAACRNAWGSKNSLRSNIMPPVSKHCSAARCASQRCPLDKLLMLAAKTRTSLAFARLHVTFRPWRGITFCVEDSLTYPMHYSAYNGNILKPAPSKSQQTAGQAEETGQNLFERCIYAMLLLREKRVVLSPVLERTGVCGTIAGEQCLRRREL